MLQNYLVCGLESKASIDFFGLNAYEWCGDNTYDTSGYGALQDMAKDYPVPIFFSETGCNTVRERTFNDQAAIFGPNMSPTWSGAIIYEWAEERNSYGLVAYHSLDGAQFQMPVPIQPDFSNLAKNWKAASPVQVRRSPNHYPSHPV